MKFEQNINFLVHFALTVNFNFFHNTILKCSLTPFQTSHVFKCLLYKSVENTGKGIIALKEQFMFFQQCLLSVIFIKLKFFDNFLPILSELKLLSAHSFSLEEYKSCLQERVNAGILDIGSLVNGANSNYICYTQTFQSLSYMNLTLFISTENCAA